MGGGGERQKSSNIECRKTQDLNFVPQGESSWSKDKKKGAGRAWAKKTLIIILEGTH